MSCENCLTTKKGEDEAFSLIKTKAQNYAQENQIAVAIYKEAGEYGFIEAGTAITANYPIVEIISQHS